MFNGRLFSNQAAKVTCTSRCGECGLYLKCKNPKIKAIGNNKKNILIIRGIPTSKDDEFGEPFSDDLDLIEMNNVFREFGIDLFEDCTLMNAIGCFANPFKDAKLVGKALNLCYPSIKAVIDQTHPKIIFLAGFDAVRAVIGREYAKGIENLKLWRGWNIPNQIYDAWLCPIFDPHEMLRLVGKTEDNVKNKNLYKIMSLIWRQDIHRGLNLLEKRFPNYKNLEQYCHPIMSEDDAVAAINNSKLELKGMIENGTMPFFGVDYEANGLKPHNSTFKIYSMSYSYKYKEAISFLWTDKTREAIKPILTTEKIGKIAHNMKYEDQVSLWSGGFKVRNWTYDPMIGTHILDNRSGITGLKFQSYVNYGVADYSSHMSKWLESDSSYIPNKIFEGPTKEILLYNGMDSLLTFMLAMKQMKMIGLIN